jgi:LEA14-like dessication related protein
VAVFAILALLFASVNPRLEISLRPATESFTATLSGSGGEAASGELRGRLALNGSAVEVPVSGSLRRTGPQWRLPLTLRYADVPADWVERYHPASFQYLLRGHAAGAEIHWSGTQRWDAVEVEGDRQAVSRFVSLRSIELTNVSFLESEGRALVAVRNPFAFPLKVASTRYQLSANERQVGEGATRGMLLRPEQVNTLTLPVEIDHGELLAAAGRAILSGGKVQARLLGTLTIRLPRGDVAVPLDLSGDMSVGR